METTCDGCGKTFDLFEDENHASEEVFRALGSIHISLCGDCSDEMPTMVMAAEDALRGQERAMDEAVELDRYERKQAFQAADVWNEGPCDCHGYPAFDCPNRWEEGPILCEGQEDYESARYWRELELEEVHAAAASRRALYQPFEDAAADRYYAKMGL